MHTLLLVALTLLFSGYIQEPKAECTKESPESLLGTYDVKQASRYHGGLTSEEAAQERIGSEVRIEKNQMVSDFASIEQPRYQIKCYPAANKEGVVAQQHLSTFYGIGLDRDSVKVLEVYAEGDPNDEPSYYFEVVNDELWELYDGWLYTLTKSSEPQDT
ncbi:hypothetical protein [Marinimicrobium locisalis]|uniref:hypothetical protein n=1 Tax=Marinimicrobium locisalis TaxID=546022 RepID=UPI003221A965